MCHLCNQVAMFEAFCDDMIIAQIVKVHEEGAIDIMTLNNAADHIEGELKKLNYTFTRTALSLPVTEFHITLFDEEAMLALQQKAADQPTLH